MSRPFTDQYGTELTIAGETALPGCARIGISERCGAHIPAEDFPELVGALYAAAGKPAPVILDRPELSGDQSLVAALHNGLVAVGAEGGLVRLSVSRDVKFTPDSARLLAAHIAARADEAASEPDPAEVDALTRTLRTNGAGLTTTSVEDIARTVLRAGWKREARP